MQADDILKQHKNICPFHSTAPLITLSLDGVQESNSTNTTLEVFTIRFKGCRNIYPLKIVRPNYRYKYDEQEEIRKVINDLNETDMVLDTAVCDNLKRCIIKNVKAHSAKFPCEYCECCAVRYIDNTMSKSQLTWPPKTMNGRPRTITAIRRIVNSIEEDEEELSADYLKGIKGRSVLLDQPNFDYVLDVPTEYLHLVCLGVVKRILELTYKIGKKRHRVTKRKRTDPKLFNELIISVQVIREFSRRLRHLDTAVLKAQEYRNILLFFFPIVLANIDGKYQKEHQMWLSLVFMIKSCVIQNEEFQHVDKETIIKSCELFYNLYFELFGQQNCSYSIHIVSSHLLKVRGNVPFTERSAFPFESFYSEMQNLFKSGTRAPLKQILGNTFMKRTIEHHTCEKTIVYKEEEKQDKMENNSLIYTFKDKEHHLYVIKKIEGDLFTCQRQGKFKYKPSVLPNYNWNSIGVFRKGPIGTDIYVIHKSEIKGKVLSVLNMLITCPQNVMNEK